MTTKNNKLFITGFILPCILVLLVIYLYPVLRTIAMSFFKVDGITADLFKIDPETGNRVLNWRWAGLKNYNQLFHSRDFLISLWNMTKLFLIGGVLTVTISIIFGTFLSAKNQMPGRNAFRTLIYMPNMLSAIAIGNAFYYFVFEERFGLLTSIWKFFGATPIKWMQGNNLFNAMMFAIIFCGVGYYMLIMISGIESIPDDLYEAAVLDGAGPIAKFFYITLPLMKGTIRNIVTFWSISALQMFAWNKVFSPITTELPTLSPIVYMYEVLFGSALAQVEADVGLGAAIGITTAVLTQVVYTILNWVLKSDDLEF